MNLEKKKLVQIISALGILNDEIALFFDKHGLDPAPESQASSELTVFRTESVRISYSQANALIEVSADHLISLLKSLTEPILTIAPWTLVRANLESSALASWLLDPSIDARERVQRGFALRFEGLSQQVKFVRALGLDTTKALSKIDELENLALSLGFTRVQDKNNRRIGIGQRFPKITDLINLVLDEEPSYRLFSAVTHCHLWAIQKLSFSHAQDKSPDHSGFSRNATYLEKTLQPEAIIFLCHKAAYAFLRPIWYKIQLYGYELPEFRKTLNRVFDDLEFPSIKRFWNTT